MERELTPYEALMACRERAGSDSQMARDLDTNQPRIWRIINTSKRLPAEYVLTAERLYGVDRTQLRPDLYPRGLIDGVPYDPDGPQLDVFTPIALPRLTSRAADADARFNGVDRRAGAQA
jgi:DNA-binding transcriptional regulator YdaS (Cro superfamily)